MTARLQRHHPLEPGRAARAPLKSTWPDVIDPGGSYELLVRFASGAQGLRTATLVIRSDDHDEEIYDFALQGTGILPPALGAVVWTNLAAGTELAMPRHPLYQPANHTHFA